MIRTILVCLIIVHQSFEITYYLYTKTSSSPLPFENQAPTAFDATKPTKIIIHGFWENAKKLWYKQMKDEYLRKGNFNVIQVDWSTLAAGDYLTATNNAVGVGRRVAEMVVRLHRNGTLVNVHLIGHSLGGHVAGYVGRNVFDLVKKKIGRITGLDPAGPLFEPMTIFKGLNKTDAEIVDVIHTDGGGFGYKNPLGTADFYPNGGVRHQPGCSLFSTTQAMRSLLDIVFCSHQKSYAYFIESINYRTFRGTKCDSWIDYLEKNCSNITAIMGDETRKTTDRGEALQKKGANMYNIDNVVIL